MEYYTEEEINNIIAHVKKYTIHKQANNVRPALSLIFTLLGYFASIVLCQYSAIGILFVACFTLRLFMIFHDCSHGCFFKDSISSYIRLNRMVSMSIEQFILWGSKFWALSHNFHHEVSGNLNSLRVRLSSHHSDPDAGSVDNSRTVITFSYYISLPRFKRYAYLFFRRPSLFFLIAPVRIFWITRIVDRDLLYCLKYCIFVFLIYVFLGPLVFTYFLLGQYLSGILGLVIFHLQHQVNPGYWQTFDKTDRLSHYRAQLHGSSYLRVPFFLRWVTYGIEYHHIHHLSTQVPCYLLKRCQDEGAELFYKNPRVGYWQAFRSLFHTLYDEEQGRYISFPLARWLGLQA